MRFKRLRRRTEIRKGQLDIAPLIDMMLLLLIFFMLTSHFVLQPGIKVRLPKAVTSDIVSTDSLILSVTTQDLIYLNYKPLPADQVKELVEEAARQNSSVLIKADVGASVGRIVEIWDLCRQAGIDRVSIATNESKGTF